MRLIWLLLLALAASPFTAAPQLDASLAQLPPRSAPSLYPSLRITKELGRLAINVGYDALTAASPWTNIAAIVTFAVVLSML
ncbi:hypothetical protein ACHHYP_15504 [Achlya hypogyna]|uniref:Secreted protein n=1 Tax=Achlya hypogyna TaxID=1202772 RepID=A0A1V9YAS5_ACHHY|nr:hypothetical protein ACHHYP_15504 [Achlya hypogyna]